MKTPVRGSRRGTMIDCSRNAVMKPEAVRRWIDVSASLGYNMLMLYTEETYEIPGEPYFGYGRGRYTCRELRDLDDYAAARGVELIPCIQTLAHLRRLKRWAPYADHFDIDDIMMVGDEAVYELVGKMFDTLASCFRSRTIHVGMDEAHNMGRGKYYDLHGDTDHTRLLLDHVKRISEMAAQRGLTLCMWSDMFYRLASGGDYYNGDAKIDESVRALIPSNVELVYWDYYHSAQEDYAKMIRSHEKLQKGTWFAGGLWVWTGFAPHNGFSLRNTAPAMAACRETGVRDIFMTMWGDNGGECSRFAVLPSLFYAAENLKGNTNEEEIRHLFREKFGVSWEDFMLLDLPGTPNGREDLPNNEDWPINMDKYLLYQDPFMGLMESTRQGGENRQFADCAARLRAVKDRGGYDKLFETQAALCEVLAIKAELCEHTRKAYRAGGEALRAVIAEYLALETRLEVFYDAFLDQWTWENKPFGFEVQDARLGGLMRRVRHCRRELERYLAGEISEIAELEEPLLDLQGGGEPFDHKPTSYNTWQDTITVGNI